MKNIIKYMVICAFSIVVFDIAVYFTGIKEQYFPTITARELYPDGYFKRSSILGHDITPSHPPIEFDWRDQKAMIFSNQYGCFDKNEKYESPVVYISGDSVSWGYAEYQKKFGYLLERTLGITVAKCAVTHSGQKHQLIKLKNWVKQTGIKPELILLTLVGNDATNDFLFPQATVLRGKFVDQAKVKIKNNMPQRETIPEIDKQLLDYEKKQKVEKKANYSFITLLESFLKQYSTSAKIVFKSLDTFKYSSLGAIVRKMRDKIVRNTWLFRDDQKEIREVNYQAVQEFIDYTNSQNIPVIFLTYHINQDATPDVYHFLKNQNQYVVDYTTYLKKHGITKKEVKWPINGHPNNRGNEIIANMFIDAIKENNFLFLE